MLGLSCSITTKYVTECELLVWDPVPRPGFEPRPPVLGAWSLSHWIAREFPHMLFWLTSSFSFHLMFSIGRFLVAVRLLWGAFQVARMINVGDIRNPGSVPGLGRFPGEGNGCPPQYSCLENPMDRGAWRDIVYEVTQRYNWSNFTRVQVALRSFELIKPGFLSCQWEV